MIETKRNKMGIGIDIDGTLLQTNEGFFDVLNKQYLVNLSTRDIKTYDYSEYLKEKLNQSHTNNICAAFDEYIQESQMYIPFYPKMKESVTQLIKDGNPVYILTARGPNTHRITKEWYHENFPKANGIIFSSDKGRVCKTLGLEMMVEDSPREIVGCIKNGVIPIIKSQPYNTDFRGQNRLEEGNSLYLKARRIQEYRDN